MSQLELLKTVVRALEEQGIPYMLTGSVVSSLQGEPRATHDIDIVVALAKTAIEPLLRAFPSPDYYLDEQSIADAIAHRRMFNLIDVRGGDKVDFWMLTDEPFDQSRFARRISEEVLGITLVVSRPEDTILAKLRWAKLSGGSEKQFRDALRVYEIQQPNLDLKYLEDWSQRLGMSELWVRLQQEAEPL
jgi:hypothetical protein